MTWRLEDAMAQLSAAANAGDEQASATLQQLQQAFCTLQQLQQAEHGHLDIQ